MSDKAFFSTLVAVGVALFSVIGVSAYQDLTAPQVWTELDGGLMRRCEGTTAIYRMRNQGAIDGVPNDPACQNDPAGGASTTEENP